MPRTIEGVTPADLASVVEANSGIADPSFSRSLFARRVGSFLGAFGLERSDLGKLANLHRGLNLATVLGDEVLDRLPRVDRSNLPTRGRKIGDTVGSEVDAWDQLVSYWLRNKQSRDIFIEGAKKGTQRISDELIKRIDEAAENGKRIRFKYLIVGGGPISGGIAADIGPFVGDVCVISDQDIAGEWEGNSFSTNSSSKSSERRPFPALEADTTPVVGYKSQGIILADIADGTGKNVTCVDGRNKAYIPGKKVSDANVANLVANVPNFLLGQKALLEAQRPGGNKVPGVRIDNKGIKTVPILGKDGIIRYIECEVLIAATGPGKDKPKIPNLGGSERDLYANAEFFLDIQIQNVERWARAKKGPPPTLELPRVLSWTLIKKAVACWRNHIGDPAMHPLNPLLKEETSIAINGIADGGKVLAGMFARKEQRDILPPGIAEHEIPTMTIYGLPVKQGSANEVDTDEYSKNTRIRYADLFSGFELKENEYKDFVPGEQPEWMEAVDEKRDSPRSKEPVFKAVDTKVAGWAEDVDPETGITTGIYQWHEVEVDGVSMLQAHRYNFVITATGLEKPDYGQTYGGATFFDSELNNVGLVLLPRMYAVGTAAGLTAEQLPAEIGSTLEAIDVGENTVALWANLACALRLVWTDLARNIDVRYLEKLAKLFIGREPEFNDYSPQDFDLDAKLILENPRVRRIMKKLGAREIAA